MFRKNTPAVTDGGIDKVDRLDFAEGSHDLVVQCGPAPAEQEVETKSEDRRSRDPGPGVSQKWQAQQVGPYGAPCRCRRRAGRGRHAGFWRHLGQSSHHAVLDAGHRRLQGIDAIAEQGVIGTQGGPISLAGGTGIEVLLERPRFSGHGTARHVQ